LSSLTAVWLARRSGRRSWRQTGWAVLEADFFALFEKTHTG